MSTATDGLVAAIDSENAAVFVYGVAVAYASATRRSDIDEFTAEHRSRRRSRRAHRQRTPPPGVRCR